MLNFASPFIISLCSGFADNVLKSETRAVTGFSDETKSHKLPKTLSLPYLFYGKNGPQLLYMDQGNKAGGIISHAIAGGTDRLEKTAA